MLRADLLDAMDYMMQTVRKKKYCFWWCVQVLYIGDLLQLPPVIRDEEWRTLKSYYKGKFFSIRTWCNNIRHYTLNCQDFSSN
jgi:hypothetical protein